jgi:prolyl-tRNA editing enzyme YbaK/EbsC (Cys-tRNA(Pro) deacylase)
VRVEVGLVGETRDAAPSDVVPDEHQRHAQRAGAAAVGVDDLAQLGRSSAPSAGSREPAACRRALAWRAGVARTARAFIRSAPERTRSPSRHAEIPRRGFSDSIFAIGSHSVAIVSEPLSPSAQKVQEALTALGFTYQVVEAPRPTRTAAEAAQLVGCQIGQIAKSLVFRAAPSGRPILVIASGANQVNEWRIGALLQETLEKAKAALVREHTGFAIGGVPPLGHAKPLETFIDQDLMRHSEIWAAAGTPNALFRLVPADLVKMTGGRVVKVT